MRRPATEVAHTRVERIAAVFTLFLMLGPLVAWQIGRVKGVDSTLGGNTFFVQYRHHEPVFLALMAAFAVGAAIVARHAAPTFERPLLGRTAVSSWGARHVALVAVFVFVLATLGTSATMHAFPLSMDEYVATFQSRIFASGQVSAPLPGEWQRFAWALRPVYVVSGAEAQYWVASYWPVYAAMRALFVNAGADQLVNPVLAGLSVPLVYACCRRIWPNDKQRAWLAVALLVSSSQFLFMSMTAYAMPAHLCFNLLWLYAFLRGDRIGLVSAPLIGVAALGLHNPFPHALFVTPFLVQRLSRRRLGWTAYFGTVYAAGIAMWYIWMRALPSSLGGSALLSDKFAAPNLFMLGVQQLSLSLMFSWQTPVLAILLIWVAFAWRTLSRTERGLSAGIALSFGFYFLFPTSQGHGWGYRYTYAVLGNMALLGTSGAAMMAERAGPALVQRLLIASGALTVLVQWPLRAWQIERHVRPFAQAHAYIARIDADVVIVDPTSSWYGIDLIRNDPFLRQKPKILSAYYLLPDDKHALAERFGDRVHLLEPSELARFGIPTFPSRYTRPVWPPRPITPRAAPPPGPLPSPGAPAPSSPPPR